MRILNPDTPGPLALLLLPVTEKNPGCQRYCGCCIFFLAILAPLNANMFPKLNDETKCKTHADHGIQFFMEKKLIHGLVTFVTPLVKHTKKLWKHLHFYIIGKSTTSIAIFNSTLLVHYQRVNLWFSYGFPMVFLWFSYSFPIVFLWFSYGFPIVFLWSSYGFPMVFLWFSYGFPAVILWFSYSFPIVFL